ncbi:MAG: HEPN domain-containing protein [Defluviitaleaceae bacterium]|nr:HEPN domain-containing protein [Defluviitaleaceae bacterium]
MNEIYDFKNLAEMDYIMAINIKKYKSYNHCVRMIEQYVEKSLKHIVNENGDPKDKEILSSHNVTMLAKRVEQILGEKYTQEDNSWFRSLKGYYFDTNYPGKNFVLVDEDEAFLLYDWLEKFRIKIQEQQDRQNRLSQEGHKIEQLTREDMV